MTKILLINPAEKFSQSALAKWKSANPQHQFVLAEKEGIDEREVILSHPDTNILICTYGKYTADDLKNLPHLRAVIATTTATEYIDLEYCHQHGIHFINISGYSGSAVAEHLLALLFALARKLPLAAQMHRKFASEELLGFELNGKTLGLLGYGHIGKVFARMASALGMNVLIYNRSKVNSEFKALPLDEMLPQVDILACTLPLNAETNQLINADRLAMLKKHACIITTSPEKIFDMTAVLTMLKSGAIGGAAFDIHEEHPEFYELPNFIATRTKGWYTKECVERRTQAFLARLDDYLRDKL